jgi:CRP/FNR family transcriptional regulator
MPAPGATDVLRASPLFAGLPAADLATLGAAAHEHRLQPREYVFMEGDPALWFCLVLSGRIKIVRQSRGGKDVVLELLGPGEPFGGVAVIERRPYPASAQAAEASVILKIPQHVIVPMAERHPSIVREMALMIGRRLRAAHDAVQSLAVDPVEVRLAATLLRLGEREGRRGRRGLTLAAHLTRQTLADMSGTTVETAIRIMSRWRRDGLVTEEGGHLVLVDVDALRALAAGEKA